MPALPWHIAEYVVRALPSPNAPSEPRRASPEPLNEAMHLGYALQWFLIAGLVLGGAIQLARAHGSSARRPSAGPDPPG
jgi:cytochrome oxidase assembly protein ShyY1